YHSVPIRRSWTHIVAAIAHGIRRYERIEIREVLIRRSLTKEEDMTSATHVGMVTFIVLLGLGLAAARWTDAATVNVDCNNGGAVAPALATLKPEDVLVVHGTCRENIVVPADLHDVII